MSTPKSLLLTRRAIILLASCVLCTFLLFPGTLSAANMDFPIPGVGGLSMYEAAYASNTIPDVLTSGSEYPATISFINKGLALWRENSKEKFGLLYQGGQSSVQISPIFNPIPEGVAISNGEQATFSFNIQTPDKPGTYPISFTMAIQKSGRYEPFQQAFTKTVRVVPKSGASSAQFGAISIMSAPPLSRIYLGGEYVGRTPFIIADLTPATYRVRVVDDTYGSKEVAVQVASASLTEVIFDLIDNQKTRITTEKIYEYTLLGKITSFVPSTREMAAMITILFLFGVFWIFKREKILNHRLIASFISKVSDIFIALITINKKSTPPDSAEESPSDNSPKNTENKLTEGDPNLAKSIPDETETESEFTDKRKSEKLKLSQSELKSLFKDNKTKPTDTKSIANIASTIERAQRISATKAPQAIPDLSATISPRVPKNNQELKRPISSGAYQETQYQRSSSNRQIATTKKSSNSNHQILSILKKSDPDAYIHPEEFSGIEYQIQTDNLGFPDELRDRYEPLGTLGDDIYARVFKVKTIPDGEIRALKVSHDTQPTSEILVKEANIWRKMQHENIVKMYVGDFSKTHKFTEQEYQIGFMYKGTHYISLQEIPKPIREKYAASIAIDIAKGLDYAHTLGIRHYHISLGNIMITSDFRAKLSGFARGKNELGPAFSSSIINKDAPEEELAHLAPEQKSSDAGTLGTRTDMYQLGIIFYELLTGYTPYTRTLYEQVYGEAEEKAIDDKELETRIKTTYIPPSLLFLTLAPYDDILAKLITYDKKKRYSSIRDFLVEIENIETKKEEEIFPLLIQSDTEPDRTSYETIPDHE